MMVFGFDYWEGEIYIRNNDGNCRDISVKMLIGLGNIFPFMCPPFSYLGNSNPGLSISCWMPE